MRFLTIAAACVLLSSPALAQDGLRSASLPSERRRTLCPPSGAISSARFLTPIK
jgi:hypothetical protein